MAAELPRNQTLKAIENAYGAHKPTGRAMNLFGTTGTKQVVSSELSHATQQAVGALQPIDLSAMHPMRPEPTIGYDAVFEVIDIIPILNISTKYLGNFFNSYPEMSPAIKASFLQSVPHLKLNSLPRGGSKHILYDIPVVLSTEEQVIAHIENDPTAIIFWKVDRDDVFSWFSQWVSVSWKDDRFPYKIITENCIQFIRRNANNNGPNPEFTLRLNEKHYGQHYRYNKEENKIELGTGREIYGYPYGMRAYLNSIDRRYTETPGGIIIPEGSFNPIAGDNVSSAARAGRYRKRGTMHRKKSRKHRSRRQRK